MSNKIAGIILITFSFILIYGVYKSKVYKKNEIVIQDIRDIAAALLLIIMAIGFLTSTNKFCEICPEFWFCK